MFVPHFANGDGHTRPAVGHVGDDDRSPDDFAEAQFGLILSRSLTSALVGTNPTDESITSGSP